MGLLIPTLKWTGLNGSLMISLCVSLCPAHSLFYAHIFFFFHNRKNRTFKSDLLARGFAHKPVEKHLTEWAAGIKRFNKDGTNPKTVDVNAAGSSSCTSTSVRVKLTLEQQLQNTALKVWWSNAGRCRWRSSRWGWGLKDKSRLWSGAGEGKIVRWAAFLSAQVMVEC